MTEKLYYSDSHLTSCTASVRACEPVSGGFDVLLDRTVLFPTGGGQQTDLGTIGAANVLACREEGDEVVHLVDRALPVGMRVTVTLDWARRFDYMQQHTGEHLLSFAAYTLFGAKNVGFHLADAYTTIDFDRPLSHEELLEAETLANGFIWRNLPVTATLYESEDAIADLSLRKHAEGLKGPIRIVAIQDADCCTCCAPHCRFTGEIGSIRITDAAAYKGGTRITFLCGKRALLAAQDAHDTLDRIARRFSVSRADAEGAVTKLADQYNALKRDERALTAALNRYVAAELSAQAVSAGKVRILVAQLDSVPAARLKDLAQAVSEPRTLVLLLSQTEGKLYYVLSTGEGFPADVGELMPAVNAATGGKGGGRGTLAQGMSPSCGALAETVAQLTDYFTKRFR